MQEQKTSLINHKKSKITVQIWFNYMQYSEIDDNRTHTPLTSN